MAESGSRSYVSADKRSEQSGEGKRKEVGSSSSTGLIEQLQEETGSGATGSGSEQQRCSGVTCFSTT
jgi:hypothetical protein